MWPPSCTAAGSLSHRLGARERSCNSRQQEDSFSVLVNAGSGSDGHIIFTLQIYCSFIGNLQWCSVTEQSAVHVPVQFCVAMDDWDMSMDLTLLTLHEHAFAAFVLSQPMMAASTPASLANWQCCRIGSGILALICDDTIICGRWRITHGLRWAQERR